MYCRKCGQKIEEDESFCSNCGTKIEQREDIFKWNPENKAGKRILFPVLIVCLLLGAGICYFNMRYQYLAVVSDENGKYGYMNEKGKEIIECKYDDAFSFQKNGLAAVAKKAGKDANGNDLFKWGYINRKGEEVVPLQYDGINVDGFAENGLAAVAREVGYWGYGAIEYAWGFINEKGEEVIPCQYYDYYVSGDQYRKDAWNEEGIIVVAKKSGIKEGGYPILAYGVIDENGEEIIPCQYDEVKISDSDLIAVRKDSDTDENPSYRWGFINRNNETVIPFTYQYAGVFSENGLAPVCKMKEDEYVYGYINELGETAIPFQFDCADNFSENGLALVQNESGYSGFINEKGELIVPYKYSGSDGFQRKNVLKVWNYRTSEFSRYSYGLLTDTGEEVIPCEYANIVIGQEYAILSNYYEQCGLADFEGNILIPVAHDLVSEYGDNGWAVVGQKTGEYSDEMVYSHYHLKDRNRYRCQYINKKGKVVMEVPEKYQYAEQFIKVK